MSEESVSKSEKKVNLVSIVSPAYNEEQNIPILYDRLKKVMEHMGVAWEWIIVDDHSADNTYSEISNIARDDRRVRGIRLAKNHGAHLALTCSLHAATGDCAIALAADLQDPPESIPELLDKWQDGYKIVWAAREERQGEGKIKLTLSRAYWWIMRSVIGFKDMSTMGADFFLLDRQVLDEFRSYREKHTSVLALFSWMGYEQSTVFYTKQARVHGVSGWTFRKKLKLLVDSITGFSYFPIRFMSYLGFSLATLGFLYALLLIFNAFIGSPPQGWTTILVVVLLIGGIQMIMMGILGEYLWRTLDEARSRSLYLVEETTSSTRGILADDV